MRKLVTMTFLALILAIAAPPQGHAAKKADIDREVNAALEKLYSDTAIAKALAEQAEGILVFPNIVKGGLIIGGQYGDGALRQHGATTGYYRSVAVSYGLQAGVQSFGYALFFMKQSALDYLKNSKGWEIGVGPSIVVVDKGAAKSFSTTTAKSDVYAIIFGQKGLMAGIGLQGTKITKIKPK